MSNWTDIGVSFDWISPTLTVFEMIRGKRRIVVDIWDIGMTGNDVTRLLKSHGIKVGLGRFLRGWDLCLTVSDRKKALWILSSYGISAR